jgi:hypothetical protein
MKKFTSMLVLCLVFVCLYSTRGYAQQNLPFWQTAGNSNPTGAFLGTLNNEPLIFKTNSTVRLRIKANGDVLVKSLENLGTGFVTFDNDGKLIPKLFNGGIDEVLTATGTFQSLSILNGWKKTNANDLVSYNVANIGIGTNTPTEKLSVVGNIYNDGFLLTRGISIIGRAQGENFVSDTMHTSIMLMDTLSKIEGETRIVGSASVTEKLGIGTKYPTEALEIVGNSRISGNSSVSGTISGNLVAGNQLKMSPISANSLLTTDASGLLTAVSLTNLQNNMYLPDPNFVSCDPSLSPIWNNAPGKMFINDMCAFVGIGTPLPQYNLDVIGTAHISGLLKIGNSSLFLGSTTTPTGTTNNIYSSNGDLLIQCQPGNTTTVLNNNNTGDVAIGTATTFAKLQVYGGLLNGINEGKTGMWVEIKDQQNIMNTIFSSGSRSIRFFNNLAAGGYNATTHDGDAAIIWTDGNSSDDHNATSGLTIAPYGFGPSLGIRITNEGKIEAQDFLINGISLSGLATNPTQWVTGGSGINYPSGNVGIGTASTGSFKLAVEGKVGARDFYVIDTGAWPDYVFSKNYVLTDLSELKEFISKNKHLPGFKNADEIEKPEQHAVGEIQRLQQEKIEELYLYVIQLKEEIETLKKK